MTTEAPAASDVTRLPLKTLGLRTGMALQTRRLVEGASKKRIPVLVHRRQGRDGRPTGCRGRTNRPGAGRICVVRGFTGIYEYSLSKVLQTFEKPFAYACWPTRRRWTRARYANRCAPSGLAHHRLAG